MLPVLTMSMQKEKVPQIFYASRWVLVKMIQLYSAVCVISASYIVNSSRAS